MFASGENAMIPHGELRCIWMDAGQVSYKLCDRALECETCPFDMVLRSQYSREDRISSPERSERRPPAEPPAVLKETGDYFEQKLQQLLLPFSKVRLPEDRLYTREHFWIKEEARDLYRVGIDHLGVTLLSSIAGIVFTQTPSYVERGAPCVWVVHPDGALALTAPISGTMLYANRSMSNCPFLLLNFPYTEGWLATISPDSIGMAGGGVMDPDDAAEHFVQQGQVLRVAFREEYRKTQPDIGPTLHDGGVTHATIPQMLGLTKYFEIIHKFYLAP